MTSFNDKERVEENKFAHDKEAQFKITARRNKLLGLWAAEKFDYSGEKAEAYAKEVVLADFEEVGDEDVFRKLTKDFAAASINVTEHEIREQMYRLMEEARRQIAEGK